MAKGGGGVKDGKSPLIPFRLHAESRMNIVNRDFFKGGQRSGDNLRDKQPMIRGRVGGNIYFRGGRGG
jgi:hypothetical protein